MMLADSRALAVQQFRCLESAMVPANHGRRPIGSRGNGNAALGGFETTLLTNRVFQESLGMSTSPTVSNSVGLDTQSAAEHALLIQQLFIRHQSVVLAYVLSIEPNMSDAQDIVQETFLTVSRKADTFVVGTNFPAWACTVARYQTLSFQRQRSRHARALDDDVIALIVDHASMSVATYEEEISILKNCMLSLSPRAREVICARYHRQCMPEDIAKEIGWTPNAVRVALSRARTVLRTCLETRIASGGPA